MLPQGETSDSALARLRPWNSPPSPVMLLPRALRRPVRRVRTFRRNARLGSEEHDEGSAPMTDRPIRASDKERESVVDVLRDAYTDGRLTLDEFEERTSAAYGSKTWADLRELTAGLPVE